MLEHCLDDGGVEAADQKHTNVLLASEHARLLAAIGVGICAARTAQNETRLAAGLLCESARFGLRELFCGSSRQGNGLAGQADEAERV